jgi:molybdenum cofactor cytidylyltransferase
VVKCAPLYLAEHVIAAVEALRVAEEAVVSIDAFRPRRVAFIAVEERLRGGAFDRAVSSLQQALAWYGSAMGSVIRTDATTPSVKAAYRQAVADSADLILAASAASADPLDVMFEGLRQAGGAVLQIGIPAEPGTACWFGSLGTSEVLGLASCELFGRPGALDLLLPRLHVGEPLDGALMRRIALGGLVLGGPSRVLPYHTIADEA